MIAKDLLAEDIIPLRTSDTGEEALRTMNDFFVRHLPIVNNKELLGLVSEDDILEHDVNEAVGTYRLSIHRPYVQANAHLYEVMNLMSEHKLTVVPVVDERRHYLGLISQSDLLFAFSRMASFGEPGAILVLEMSKRDYSLGQIAQIVEGENTAILSSWVSEVPDSTLINLTLKLNRHNAQAVIAAFNRYDIVVKASFQENEYSEILRERYDALMRYLNI